MMSTTLDELRSWINSRRDLWGGSASMTCEAILMKLAEIERNQKPLLETFHGDGRTMGTKHLYAPGTTKTLCGKPLGVKHLNGSWSTCSVCQSYLPELPSAAPPPAPTMPEGHGPRSDEGPSRIASIGGKPVQPPATEPTGDAKPRYVVQAIDEVGSNPADVNEFNDINAALAHVVDLNKHMPLKPDYAYSIWDRKQERFVHSIEETLPQDDPTPIVVQPATEPTGDERDKAKHMSPVDQFLMTNGLTTQPAPVPAPEKRVKLSAAQRETLKRLAENTEGWCYGGRYGEVNASSARSLVSRGLAQYHLKWDENTFEITDAGRDALALASHGQ